MSATQSAGRSRPEDGQARVVAVTGGASGIGEACSRHFAAAGDLVFVLDRDAGAGRQLAAALGAGVRFLETDVGDRDSVRSAFDAIAAHSGRLQVLVNSAGVESTALLESLPEEDWDRVLAINLKGTMLCTQAAVGPMRMAGGGSVVNIASMLGHVGSTPVKQASYCASKGAVVNMTRELALQFARKNVRVNALCPGWFPSEMTAGMESDEGSIAFVQANSPIPRMGEPHELDGALLLLASPASTFMTGQSLIVDGGWTAR